MSLGKFDYDSNSTKRMTSSASQHQSNGRSNGTKTSNSRRKKGGTNSSVRFQIYDHLVNNNGGKEAALFATIDNKSMKQYSIGESEKSKQSSDNKNQRQKETLKGIIMKKENDSTKDKLQRK